jgi:hypothetical protein
MPRRRTAPPNAVLLALLVGLLLASCQENATLHLTGPVTTGPTVVIVEAPDAGSADADDDAALDPDAGPAAWMPPEAWTVHVDADAPQAVQIAAADLVRYLGLMGLQVDAAPSHDDQTTCEEGRGHAVLTGGALAAEPLPGATDQTFRIQEQRCGVGGMRVALGGGGTLGRQYAAYEWLHALGVRFFHPEQEYVPEAPRWDAAPRERLHTPPFRIRSVSLHLTHPLEMGDPFRRGDEAFFPEVQRFIDWEIKNLASNGKKGIGTGELAGYGLMRGFWSEAGFDLHNRQQGGSSIINPDDPRSWQEQVTDAIELRMGDDPERYPQHFGFTFNPSEFTEIDDQLAVEQMTFIADLFAERYPDTRLTTINHGTYGPPTEHYGVRFYDLPRFAPPNLGVRVHTLMFYDVFRPAPVYGNADFNFLYDFMAEEHTVRPIWYFPEAAWWLTFDIAVPLYLPITVEARHRDIQGLKWMLSGKLEGHHVFGTGHEWGYWQNEYCSFRLAADLDYSWRDCFADIADTAGPTAAPRLLRALERTVALQERDIVYGDLLPWLVGTDPETEVAYAAGIVFHELPPAITELLTWDEPRIQRWMDHTRPLLQIMEDDYADLVADLRAVRSAVPERGLPWFDEILDGIEVTGLRARHARNVYGAAITLRLAQLRGDADLLQQAHDLFDLALDDTQDALAVVARREAHYRYKPLDRAIAGGPDGDQDDNWTVYGYRYLNRTHHAYYYTRIDGLVEAALQGADTPIAVDDALLSPTQELVARVYDLSLQQPSFDFGDGATAPGPTAAHTYDAPGVYTLTATALRGAEPFTLSGRVAALLREWGASGRATVQEPTGAAVIAALIPGVTLGTLDATTLAVGFESRGDGTIALDAFDLLTLDTPRTQRPPHHHPPPTSRSPSPPVAASSPASRSKAPSSSSTPTAAPSPSPATSSPTPSSTPSSRSAASSPAALAPPSPASSASPPRHSPASSPSDSTTPPRSAHDPDLR